MSLRSCLLADRNFMASVAAFKTTLPEVWTEAHRDLVTVSVEFAIPGLVGADGVPCGVSHSPCEVHDDELRDMSSWAPDAAMVCPDDMTSDEYASAWEVFADEVGDERLARVSFHVLVRVRKAFVEGWRNRLHAIVRLGMISSEDLLAETNGALVDDAMDGEI